MQAAELQATDFYHEYVKGSCPVVIKNGIKPPWRPPEEWTNDFLRQKIGHKQIVTEVAGIVRVA